MTMLLTKDDLNEFTALLKAQGILEPILKIIDILWTEGCFLTSPEGRLENIARVIKLGILTWEEMDQWLATQVTLCPQIPNEPEVRAALPGYLRAGAK